jgi:hypothetical protein
MILHLSFNCICAEVSGHLQVTKHTVDSNEIAGSVLWLAFSPYLPANFILLGEN